MQLPIYMDNHATTRLDPRVLEAMMPFLTEAYGNAASRSHQFGWEADQAVEESRKQIARLIGASPQEIIFTSGATESNNLAIKGVLEACAGMGDHVVTCAIEHKAVLDAMGDQARYIGAIGAGSVAKLVHNLSGAAVNVALAEAFTMGVKAGIEPLALWAAIRQGAGGRARLFDRMGGKFLTGQYDPPDFALRLLHKDVSLACQLGREVGVPMRLSHLALAELNEALNRGWSERDSRVGMKLQEERSGIEPLAVDPARIKEVLERDG